MSRNAEARLEEPFWPVLKHLKFALRTRSVCEIAASIRTFEHNIQI